MLATFVRAFKEILRPSRLNLFIQLMFPVIAWLDAFEISLFRLSFRDAPFSEVEEVEMFLLPLLLLFKPIFISKELVESINQFMPRLARCALLL